MSRCIISNMSVKNCNAATPHEDFNTDKDEQRGQDAAGITVSQGGRVYQAKGNGLVSKCVNDIFLRWLLNLRKNS